MIGEVVMLGKQRRRYFSYDDLEELTLRHRREIMARGYHHVVALLRGGAYAATMISQSTGIPMLCARYDRASAQVSLDGPLRPGTRVLLVEDVAGKGRTLADTKSFLEAQGCEVDVFCVCWDELSRVQPRYGVCLGQGERYIFPWERTLLHPTDPERRASDSDTAQWRTAFDLDGIFVADLPPDDYLQDLESTLRRRDALPALPLPTLWHQGDTIISGRLECDRERTLDWLARHGIEAGALWLRPDTTVPPAEYKLRICLELGICEFVESDLEQARHIARYPHLVVWHASEHGMRRVSARG